MKKYILLPVLAVAIAPALCWGMQNWEVARRADSQLIRYSQSGTGQTYYSYALSNPCQEQLVLAAQKKADAAMIAALAQEKQAKTADDDLEFRKEQDKAQGVLDAENLENKEQDQALELTKLKMAIKSKETQQFRWVVGTVVTVAPTLSCACYALLNSYGMFEY